MLGTSTMVTVMPHSLGQFLKEARTRQGLSLETIAERTRINLSHLRALEENDFSKLPPLIFARAYLKEYTRCLSLQESQQADLMVRFAESAGAYYSRKQVATEKPHKRTWGSSFKLSR